MKLRDLVKMIDKKEYLPKSNNLDNLEIEGYNQAIDEIGKMEVKMDKNKLINFMIKTYKKCPDDQVYSYMADAIITALPSLMEVKK